jgi:hypothetical protein
MFLNYMHREGENPEKIVSKLQGKEPFGRRKRKWEYNIKMDIEDVEYKGEE